MAKRVAPKNVEFCSHAEFYQKSAYAKCPQEHRAAGSYAQNIACVEHEPLDVVETAVPDLVVSMPLSNLSHCLIDVGEGINQYAEVIKGRIAVMPAHAELRARVVNRHSLMNFSMPQTHVDELLANAGVSGETLHFNYGKVFEGPSIALLLRRIWRACESPDSTNDLLIDGLTLQLLAYLTRQQNDFVFTSKRRGKGQLSGRTLAEIDLYIDQYMESGVTIRSLAQLAGMSEFHFLRCFKAEFGESPYQYVLNRKIERAKNLLAFSPMSLAQIAQACGFSSQSHMNDQFRNRVGTTPGVYRSVRLN